MKGAMFKNADEALGRRLAKTVLLGLEHAGDDAALGLFAYIFQYHLDIRKPG